MREAVAKINEPIKVNNIARLKKLFNIDES